MVYLKFSHNFLFKAWLKYFVVKNVDKLLHRSEEVNPRLTHIRNYEQESSRLSREGRGEPCAPCVFGPQMKNYTQTTLNTRKQSSSKSLDVSTREGL